MDRPGWTGEPAGECAWCRFELDDRSPRRWGRADCPRCRSATTDPVPDQASLDHAYGDWYWPSAGQRFSLVGDALLRRSRAAMAGRIDEIAPPGPVLDVGAGEGTLVDALNNLGRSASGLERESDRPDIENIPIEQVTGRYSAVVFWHSLEHLEKPRDAIAEAARLLEPGGVVVVAVPNYESAQAAAFGDRWLHLDLPRHLVHLSRSGLVAGLEAEGFRVRRVSGLRAGQVVIGWLDGLVTSLPGELSLYQSLRRRSARRVEIGPGRRVAAIAAGVVLFPLAVACAAAEVIAGRSGTVYIEAERV
jgi:SAM-dependent methyltransferase